LGSAQIQPSELDHTQNSFQIDFFGLDFRPGETLRYQYKLEGTDSDWSALNSEGTPSDRPAMVSFKILSPIWLRWWFIALAVLLVLALLYLLHRYRLARLAEAKRAEENLSRAREERIVELQRVRTRIATDLHDDIGASLTQIAILSQVAQQGITGNGASLAPLKSISNVSNELVETMSDIVWAINPQKDHLQDLIQRMRRFGSDILSARGINLAFNAPTIAPEIPLGANARREIFLIFKESLNNVIKHSDATQVRIEFKVSTNALTLEIADNGKGFDPANVTSVLFSDQKGGNGILSMKRRAGEMNGKFEIESAKDKGTLITFHLPLMESPAGARGGS